MNILIIRNKKVLLGLLTEKWLYQDQQVYGVPDDILSMSIIAPAGRLVEKYWMK